MGQKVSNSHSSSEISLSKKDSRNFKLKSKKCANWSREKINVDVQPNLANTFADTEKLNDDDDGTRKNADDDNNTVKTNSLAYPSIAELSNFTALSMMRNLEDVSKLKNQLNETNEKLMDDDFNEKCFNTINYEDIPVVQLVENTMSLRRDSSTCTNEIKELSRDNSLEDVEDDVAEKLSCKDSEQSVVCYHEREMEKSEEDEMEETLEAKLERTERERDEAMSRLRIVEVRCEAYEEESKCLEASMQSMEKKLRTIVSELHNEVTRSKDLERQLSITFQNSGSNIPTHAVDNVEKLISQALHS